MNIEIMRLRAAVIQALRRFFVGKDYLETDTPSLSRTLIPETCLEVFKTSYVSPWNGTHQDLFLVPSPEVYIKPLIAEHGISLFQISKCYRNIESIGRIHASEFTMLEYYTMNADYADSITISESLFAYVAHELESQGIPVPSYMKPPFARLSMNEAFECFAGFPLYTSDDQVVDTAHLAEYARSQGLSASDDAAWDDLYELIFVHCIEERLGEKSVVNGEIKPLILYNYPALVPCLAKDVISKKTGKALWKERWELYAQGVELANCYSEENNADRVKNYMEHEGAQKNRTARIPHAIDEHYWQHFVNFPHCSGVALGVDRLIMLLSGCSSLESVLYRVH